MNTVKLPAASFCEYVCGTCVNTSVCCGVTHPCMSTCGDQSLVLGVLHLPLLTVEKGPSLNLQLLNVAKLVNKQIPGILLSVSSSSEYRHMPPFLIFI